MWKSLFSLLFSLLPVRHRGRWMDRRERERGRETLEGDVSISRNLMFCVCVHWHRELQDGLKILLDLFMSSLFTSHFLYTLTYHNALWAPSISTPLPFCFSLPSSLWYFDRSICSSVKKTHFPHRLLKKKNFVKGACWENSSLPAAAGILDLYWWVSTLRNRTDTGS